MDNIESVPGTKNWNFLDHRFITCIHSITEVLTALSVMALPLESGKHEKQPSGDRGQKITAGSNFILLKKEIQEGKPKINQSIFVN